MASETGGRQLLGPCVILLAARMAAGGGLDPKELFEPAVTLRDPRGAELQTNLAVTCPYAVDWSGDGKVDLIFGAHESMDTSRGGIWLLKNLGSNSEPVFDMNAAQRVTAGGQPLKVSCG